MTLASVRPGAFDISRSLRAGPITMLMQPTVAATKSASMAWCKRLLMLAGG
ncbi:Hypothetical protein Cp4202_0297 [Corynebacterium pseudotuberculosis 42/02-A]|nr:Hypothetical protein Cp4202_0297 [Corynebacterium pseudotuberculosis 42/02-A]